MKSKGLSVWPMSPGRDGLSGHSVQHRLWEGFAPGGCDPHVLEERSSCRGFFHVLVNGGQPVWSPPNQCPGGAGPVLSLFPLTLPAGERVTHSSHCEVVERKIVSRQKSRDLGKIT